MATTDRSTRNSGQTVSDYQTIRYQRDGGIGTLTLARPGKRNAQNPLDVGRNWPGSAPGCCPTRPCAAWS